MGCNERKAIISKIESHRKSRVICYLTSNRQNADVGINKDVIPIFLDHLRRIGKRDKIDVFIYTSGGDTLAAFGVARLIREFSPRLGVLIPMQCHSAGTLLALGANDIVMTAGATLSPIDPSVVGALNPAVEIAPGQRQMVPLSVETVAGFKDLVTRDWDIKGEDALVAAFKTLAEKVHPLALGDVYRARNQIEMLARTLMQAHRTDSDTVEHVIKKLARELGSHDYPISRMEARELLKSQVAAEDETLEALLLELLADFEAEMELRKPFTPDISLAAARIAGQTGPITVTHKLAFIETAEAGDVAERDLVINQPSAQLPLGAPPQLLASIPKPPMQVTIVRGEWRHYVC
jgi:ClpP class serine protease